MSTKDLKRELGKKELYGIAIGQVIEAGIMALAGLGIAMTRKSVNLALCSQYKSITTRHF